jgi:hypothetical protein
MNLMVTMLLGGLWHGANYTFVVWGGLHGAFLVVNHVWRAAWERLSGGESVQERRSPWASIIARSTTFLCVSVAWVFFRSNDMRSASNLLRDLAGFRGAHTGEVATQQLFSRNLAELALTFFGAAILVWAMPNTSQISGHLERAFTRRAPGTFYARVVPATAGVVLALALVEMRRISSFLYFQF